MKLRSKWFTAPVVITFFVIIFLSADCRNVSAQVNSGKKAETKTADKAKANSAAVLVTFVEIGAASCIPCKMMQPIMKEVAQEYKGQVKVVFHDVWTPQGKIDGMKYNIRVIPTQVFLDKNGKEYYRHEGYFPKEELVKVLKMQGVK